MTTHGPGARAAGAPGIHGAGDPCPVCDARPGWELRGSRMVYIGRHRRRRR